MHIEFTFNDVQYQIRSVGFDDDNQSAVSPRPWHEASMVTLYEKNEEGLWEYVWDAENIHSHLGAVHLWLRDVQRELAILLDSRAFGGDGRLLPVASTYESAECLWLRFIDPADCIHDGMGGISGVDNDDAWIGEQRIDDFLEPEDELELSVIALLRQVFKLNIRCRVPITIPIPMQQATSVIQYVKTHEKGWEYTVTAKDGSACFTFTNTFAK